jgi:cell division transport system permease protein
MSDADLADMVGKMKLLPAVDDVETYQSWTEKLGKLVRGGLAAAGILALVVFAAVLAVIGSTMRLVLQRRRTEVEVLKLVGATDAFVKKPFIIEGSVQGGLGALGAIALLGMLFFVVRGRLDSDLANMVGLEPSFLPWPVAGAMILLGAVLGALAALASLRKLVAV